MGFSRNEHTGTDTQTQTAASMPVVVKIKFQNTLRRVTVYEDNDGKLDLNFQRLEAKIRDMFELSPSCRILITYRDEDDEIVTMANDEDLLDACVAQKINPLRLDVQVADTKRDNTKGCQEVSNQSSIFDSEQRRNLQAALSAKELIPEVTSDAIKQIIDGCGSLKAVPQDILATAISTVIKAAKGAASSYLSSAPNVLQGPSSMQSKSSTPIYPVLEHPARVFHKGVQCDGCGIMPIIGPRFKSIKKEDYDLCFRCYTEMGNASDYVKIDKPVHCQRNYNHPIPVMRQRVGQPTLVIKPHLTKGPFENVSLGQHCGNGNPAADYSHGGKLDARFVQHVTIIDGTEVLAKSNFTKKWRLRNVGTTRWPHLTQLVHVSGDILACDKFAKLEVPEQGLPCGEEVEVSVELAAPEQPGRYVSHWRLMAPWGQKFGQRLWVNVQVVAKSSELDDTSPTEIYHVERREHMVLHQNDPTDKRLDERGEQKALHQNQPLVMTNKSCGACTSTPASCNISQTKHCSVQESVSQCSLPMSDTLIDVQIVAKHESLLLTEDREMVDEEPDTIDVEVGGFSLIEMPNETSKSNNENLTIASCRLEATLMQEDESNATIVSGSDTGSAGLSHAMKSEEANSELKEQLDLLDSMGFSQRGLNLKLLRKNKGNLHSTIEDLVAASEWDYLLDDLEEMGFKDRETNCCLLLQNKGSVKLVVKELLKMQCSGCEN